MLNRWSCYAVFSPILVTFLSEELMYEFSTKFRFRYIFKNINAQYVLCELPNRWRFFATFSPINKIVLFQELIREISFIYNPHNGQRLSFNFHTVILNFEVLTIEERIQDCHIQLVSFGRLKLFYWYLPFFSFLPSFISFIKVNYIRDVQDTDTQHIFTVLENVI